MTSGFTAAYVFLYCVHYYITKLEFQEFISMILYFGYTLIMCFLFFLLTGITSLSCLCLLFATRHVGKGIILGAVHTPRLFVRSFVRSPGQISLPQYLINRQCFSKMYQNLPDLPRHAPCFPYME